MTPRTVLFLSMALALVGPAVSPAYAAPVEGIVLNGATGKPQPGATVTLFRLASANGPRPLETVKSDPSGKFSMTKEVPGPRMMPGRLRWRHLQQGHHSGYALEWRYDRRFPLQHQTRRCPH